MPQYGWTDKSIIKAMAMQKGSISLMDAGIPLVEGSYVLPPVIAREGVTYKLQKQDRQEPYKNIVRVNKENGDAYSYAPVADEDAEVVENAQAQTEAYDYSMKPESSTFQKLTEKLRNSKTLGVKEEEILDIEFSADDKPINELIEAIADHFSKPSSNVIANRLDDLLQYLETQGMSEAVLLRNELESGIKSRTDVETVAALLKNISNTNVINTFERPLIAYHVQALFEYKISTYASKTHGHELNAKRDTLMNVNNFLTAGFAVHNVGHRVERDTTAYSKSLVTAAILNQAVAKNLCIEGEAKKKEHSCFCDQQGVDFTKLPGFSKQAGWSVQNFFANAEQDLEIEIDGKPINYVDFNCGSTAKRRFKKIDIKNTQTQESMSIDYTEELSTSERRADEFSTVLRKSRDSKAVELSLSMMFMGNYMSMSHLGTVLGSLDTKHDFLTVKSGRNTKKFKLTYSRDVIHNHRGEIGQIFTALVHSHDESKDLEPVESGYEDFLDELIKHRDEMGGIIKKLMQKPSKSKNTRVERAVASILPLLTALDKYERPSPSQINFSYLRYYGLLDGLIESPEEESIAEAFIERNGYLPETMSRALANLQRRMVEVHQYGGKFKAIKGAAVESRHDKTTRIADIENSIVQDLIKQLSSITDPFDTSEEEYVPSLLQKVNDLVESKGKRKGGLNISLLKEDERKDIVGGLVDILSNKGAAWGQFYEKLTGIDFDEDEFFTSIVTNMLNGSKKTNISQRFYEPYMSMLVLGDYLTKVVSDESTQLSLVHLDKKNLGKIANDFNFKTLPNPIEFVRSIMLEPSMGKDSKYKVAASKRNGEQTEIFLFNSKRSSGSSSGMVDYGVEVFELNQHIAEDTQVSYDLRLRTDAFEFKSANTETAIRVPHINDGITFAQTSTDNILSLATELVGNVPIRSITTERGINVTVGTRRGKGRKMTHGYILRDAPDDKLRQHVLGKAATLRRVPIEEDNITSEANSLPVYFAQLYFDGSSSYNPISIHREKYAPSSISVTKSFAETYAKRYAQTLKENGDQERIFKSYIEMLDHPLIGNLGFHAFVEEMNK